MARMANMRLNMLRQGEMGVNAINRAIKHAAIQRADHGLPGEAVALKCANTGVYEVDKMIECTGKFLEFPGESPKGNLDAEAAAAITAGNPGKLYVGEPYGTHVWCENEGAFVFVGSGGTHGVNILLLLLGAYEEISPELDENDPMAQMLSNMFPPQQGLVLPKY